MFVVTTASTYKPVRRAYAWLLDRVRLHAVALRLILGARRDLRVADLSRALINVTPRACASVRRHPIGRSYRAVCRVGRWVPGSVCLDQALATVGLELRQARRPELILGCRRASAEWAAHAWVVVDGITLDAAPLGCYMALTRYSICGDVWRRTAVEPVGQSPNETCAAR